MPIRFDCESCKVRIKVPDGTEGKKVKCPSCGHSQRVPQESAAAPPPAEEPAANAPLERHAVKASLKQKPPRPAASQPDEAAPPAPASASDSAASPAAIQMADAVDEQTGEAAPPDLFSQAAEHPPANTADALTTDDEMETQAGQMPSSPPAEGIVEPAAAAADALQLPPPVAPPAIDLSPRRRCSSSASAVPERSSPSAAIASRQTLAKASVRHTLMILRIIGWVCRVMALLSLVSVVKLSLVWADHGARLIDVLTAMPLALGLIAAIWGVGEMALIKRREKDWR